MGLRARAGLRVRTVLLFIFLLILIQFIIVILLLLLLVEGWNAMFADAILSRRTLLSATVGGLCIAGAGRRIRAQEGAKATRFQIGCMTLPYSQYPLGRALSGIRSAGYQYVAWGTTHREAGE